TRGCSAGRDLGVVAHAVLPADAGVFRSPAPNCCAPPSPPRRRGGVPTPEKTRTVPPLSSPPTRGCSDLRGHRVPAPHVLPADAGVFRRASRWCAMGRSPPRRRGGVPPLASGATKLTRSSPPTRGWSAPAVPALTRLICP